MTDELTQRLQELESRMARQINRLIAIFGIVSFMVVWILVWAIGHGFPSHARLETKNITADRYVNVWPRAIVDSRLDGTVSYLTTDANHTRFDMRRILWKDDKSGFTSQNRLELIANDDETGLIIYDSREQPRAKLIVAEDEPHFVLLDEQGEVTFDAPTKAKVELLAE